MMNSEWHLNFTSECQASVVEISMKEGRENLWAPIGLQITHLLYFLFIMLVLCIKWKIVGRVNPYQGIIWFLSSSSWNSYI